MKKVLAALIAMTMLLSVAFASSTNSIMPRTGYFNREVKLAAGKTWTSDKYEIAAEDEYVLIGVDLLKGGDVSVELYGSNALSTAGIKVGTVSTAGPSYLRVRHNYAYYHFKVINNSTSESTSIVMLYT